MSERELRILFVSNGHGEAAIAARIAAELRARAAARTEHLPLVGEGFEGPQFPAVGPHRRLPSGGLVAMGNALAFARDIGAGWLRLFAEQVGFLRGPARGYDTLVAVGDVYNCALSQIGGRPLVFVGTAKSVFVAPYGAFERRILRRAAQIFVRDEATAADLRRHGVQAEAPGNVIVDLLATDVAYPWSAAVRLALLPGSRPQAYRDAERIVAAVAAVAAVVPGVEPVLSVAPTLDPAGFAPLLARHPMLRLWSGPLGALLAGATLAVGQAGTANEAAAANGVPVVALRLDEAGRDAWYRRRQIGLLDGSLAVVSGEAAVAGEAIASLLADEPRRHRMAAIGRERMGGAGGAAAVAAATVELARTRALGECRAG